MTDLRRVDKHSFANNANNDDIRNVKRKSYYEHQDKNCVHHGCVELGRDSGRGNVYHTRYHIDHSVQQSDLCHEIIIKKLVPCCSEKATHGYGHFILAIVFSEAFLFSLHMSTIILGVIKEAANYREEEEIMHLVHSVMESFVSILVITIRVAAAWMVFNHVKKSVKCYQKLPDKATHHKKNHTQGGSLRHYLIVLTILGAIFIILLISTFLVFYFFVHLGWTILTNQLAILIFNLASALYMSRVMSTEIIVKADQHKAVLYEANLLLQELHQVATQKDIDAHERQRVLTQTETFCKALRDTEMFLQPTQIHIDERYKVMQSLALNATQVQSTV